MWNDKIILSLIDLFMVVLAFLALKYWKQDKP